MVNPREVPWAEGSWARVDELLVDRRAMLHQRLDGVAEDDNVAEDEARRSPAPSRTTQLALVTHVTYVEKVWFLFIGSLRHSGPLDSETFARALEVSGATVGVPDGR